MIRVIRILKSFIKIDSFIVLLLHLEYRKKDRTGSRANAQPSSKYFSVRMQFILILCFVYKLSYGDTSYVLSVINIMSTSNFEYE